MDQVKKKKGIGLSLLKPTPDEGDQDIHNNDFGLDIKGNPQLGQGESQFEQMEDSIMKQIEKLSLDTSQKTTEIIGSDKSIEQIVPIQNIKFELKDFKQVERLGKGIEGQVDKVVHVPTKKIYALKKIGLQNDEKFKKYLQAQIKALITCESDYIVKYSGAFFHEGHVHILLEYMNFKSLGHLIQNAKQIPDVILGIIIYQILLGLQYLHKEKKLIHRDIKPLNILINSEGFVKITDFGVCGNPSTQMLMKSYVGTTLYMGPERLSQQTYSFDTDIWSLGMTLLECILGHHPLKGKDSSVWSILEQVQCFKVPEFPQGTSSLLKDFVVQCLQSDRYKRPTIDDLLNHELIRKFKKLENGGRDKFIKWLNCLKQYQNIA